MNKRTTKIFDIPGLISTCGNMLNAGKFLEYYKIHNILSNVQDTEQINIWVQARRKTFEKGGATQGYFRT